MTDRKHPPNMTPEQAIEALAGWVASWDGLPKPRTPADTLDRFMPIARRMSTLARCVNRIQDALKEVEDE